MNSTTHFPANRTAALERLQDFVPRAGRDYAARRNYDLGPGKHTGVSTLSPYIRTRLVTEEEVLRAVLGRYALSSAEKYVQEVFWRTYWKGWLEMRPGVWDSYQHDLRRRVDAVQTQSGLRNDWETACKGETGIDCFDAWAHELVQTGYLHNHARMWFASIWIFTLRLPWELGADFFLRHLLDGDPASNTLSWRWVAGIQTRGKTYLARTSNISKYTEGRFHPKWQLAGEAIPLDAPPPPDRRPIPEVQHPTAGLRTGLILHPDDLSPGFALCDDMVATAMLRCENDLSPLHVAPHLAAFLDEAMADCTARHAIPAPDLTASTAAQLAAWAKDAGLQQIVTPYAPVGPIATVLNALPGLTEIPLIPVRRGYDSAAWPHATHGFFRFKDKIPSLVAQIKGLRAA